MFFIFSKLLLIFILPLSWALGLLTAILIVKNKKIKQRLTIILTLVLFIFSNPFLFNHFANLWDIGAVPLNNKSPYSCVIVLGGFSSGDANGNGYFNTSADRFIQGLKLIKTHRASHILISGGSGNLIPDKFFEADWVKTQLKEFGVPDSCVLIEDRSRNTIENAAFSKVILERNHLRPPFILVTSAFHMRRSLGIFKKTNIAVVPYSCNFIADYGQTIFADFLPDANVLYKWNIYIKEMTGVLVNIFKL